MCTKSMSTIVAGCLTLATLSFAPTANAMPAGAVSASPLPLATAAQPEVTLVSGGCGPFRHRGFNGFCYPNRGPGFGYGYRRPYGFYRPYGYGYGHRRFGFY